MVSDDEFISAWETSHSVQDVADVLGYKDLRSVRRRRRTIEANRNIELRSHSREPFHPKSSQYSKKNCTVVIFSDAHFWPQKLCPKPPAYHILKKVLPHIKPDVLIDNGDSFDGATISRHPPHGWQDMPSVIEEIDVNKLYHAELKKAAGNPKCYWVWGNHDARFDAKLAGKVNQFKGVQGMTLPDHFHEWEFCESVILNENMMVKHRWHGGVHAAFNNTVKAGISLVTGHTHRGNIRPYADLTGVRYGIECPTLAYKNSPQFFYCNHNPVNWQEGFLVIDYIEGIPHPEIVEVKEGKAWWRGKVWKA